MPPAQPSSLEVEPDKQLAQQMEKQPDGGLHLDFPGEQCSAPVERRNSSSKIVQKLLIQPHEVKAK